MNTLNTSSSASSGTSVLKQATKVQEKIIAQLMESLPKPIETSSMQISGRAAEGIGQNLDLKA